MRRRLRPRLGIILAAVLASASGAGSQEDARACECFYKGYDEAKARAGGNKAYCRAPGPRSTNRDCDMVPRIEAPTWWPKGCEASIRGEARQCPYKR